MHKPLAASTAAAALVLAWIPDRAAATTSIAPPAEVVLLAEHHTTTEDYALTVAVTRDAAGSVLSEATVVDANATDEVDVWTDGATVWWHGTVADELVEGSAPASTLAPGEAGLDPQAHVCLTPVGALVCLGAAAVLVAGCMHGWACDGGRPPTNPPDSSGGGGGGDAPTEEPGESDGGDGDGDGDG